MADAKKKKGLTPHQGQPPQTPQEQVAGEPQAAVAPVGQSIFRRAVKYVLPILFFSYVFGMALNYSLNDPDIWWHLKTGQYIVSTWETPEEDPFAYTTPIPLDASKKIGLRSQWLGQVIFYLAFVVGGYAGVAIFRNILIVMPMLILYIWMLRRGVGPFKAITVASFAALMFSIQLFYSFERPQGISFILSILTCIFIERMRRHGREGHLAEKLPGTKLPAWFDYSLVLLPLTMVFWANIHAGYIIGNVILIVYISAEALRAGYLKLRGRSIEPFVKWFIAFAALSIIASFLNPNSYKIFFDYVMGHVHMFAKSVAASAGGGDSGWVENVVLEYKPLIYFYRNLDYKWLIVYWVFTGVLYAMMLLKYWIRKSFDVAEFAVVSIIAFFANYYARGLMVSLAILPFYMAKTLVQLNVPSPAMAKRLFNAGVAAMLTLSIGFYTYSYSRMRPILMPGVAQMWVTPWYPARLVEFLKATTPDGPMYNFYTWGGFLIWSLYPKYKVFIDGRALDDMINRTADAILKTFPNWKEKLDAYGINFVVIPVIFRESGHTIPLATALARDDDWSLVFLKYNSAVFIRNVPRNSRITYTFSLDKNLVFQEIISVEEIFLSGSPNHPVYNIAKADALMMLGRYDEARAIYERFPRDGAHGLQRLRELGIIK